MFDIKLSRDLLVCSMTETPPGHRLIKPMIMSCDIKLELGIVPSAGAAKTLKKGMEKGLSARIKTKSGPLLNDMTRKILAIGAMIEDKDPKRAQAAKDSDYLKAEEKRIKDLWDHWSKKIAPKLANDVLQEVVASAREAELQGLRNKKIKAVGKVTAIPVLALVAAVMSGATGNVAGIMAALGKGASATMKAAEDVSSALNEFRSDQKAITRDITTISTALDTVKHRIESMNKHRKAAEMSIAALSAQTQVMVRELKSLKDTDRNAAIAIAKSINENNRATKELRDNLPDTGPLTQAWTNIAAEYKKMTMAVNAMDAQAPMSLSGARNLTDASKELLGILSKLT